MNDWQNDARRAILAANSDGESYRKMAARLGLPARRASWLCDIARGKSSPTRKLARALGVVTERDGDRVRFAVWMTRAERDALQAAIDSTGVTRREWMIVMAGETWRGNALMRILRWCEAYPLDIFPEPDMQRARELLEAGDITLDSVSASNMRHVLAGVAEIAREGLGRE